MTDNPGAIRNQLTKSQRRAVKDERERRAWRLRQQGKTYHDIAEEMGASVSTVRLWVAQKEAEVTERFLTDAAHVKADHLGKLDLMYEELLAAYYRSCEDAVEVTTGLAALNQRTGEVMDLPDKVVRRGQSGSAAILLAAAKILEDQRKITGANAPDRIEVDLSEDLALASLQKKMQDLANRTIVEEERQVQVTVGALDDDTPREQLRAALDIMKSKQIEDKRLIIPASVRAETATAGYDLELDGSDGFASE